MSTVRKTYHLNQIIDTFINIMNNYNGMTRLSVREEVVSLETILSNSNSQPMVKGVLSYTPVREYESLPVGTCPYGDAKFEITLNESTLIERKRIDLDRLHPKLASDTMTKIESNFIKSIEDMVYTYEENMQMLGIPNTVSKGAHSSIISKAVYVFLKHITDSNYGLLEVISTTPTLYDISIATKELGGQRKIFQLEKINGVWCVTGTNEKLHMDNLQSFTNWVLR